MAYDKVIDSVQLDGALTATANAIRSKAGTQGEVTWDMDDGFSSVIAGMPTGGAGLNFDVVGGTSQPTNPTENTIWVNTDVEITSWSFNTDAPANVSNGAVWFLVGGMSFVEFNALKENAITVQLAVAKQYLNGAWVDNAALIYQNGVWIDLVNIYYLFKSGDGAKIELLTYNDRDGTASITVGKDAIISMAEKSSGGFRTALRSLSPIDFSEYNVLKMRCTPTAVYTNNYTKDFENSFGATSTAITSSEPGSIAWAARTRITASSTEKTIIVDVSSIETSLYFVLHFCGHMTVSDIWLE